MCVAMSQDSSRVVSGSQDGTVRIWNISDTTDKLSVVEKKEDRFASALCLSIDRKVVVAGCDDGGISIRDAEAERTKEVRLPGLISRISSITMSNDKRYVVGGSNNFTVRMLDARTGKQVGDGLYGHEGPVHAVAISHDCRWFVSASDDKTLRLWELPSGKAIGQPLVGHTEGVSCVMISNDDRFVVSGSDGHTVRIWDVRSGTTIAEPLEHDTFVRSVYMSRDNEQTISMEWDNEVYLWSAFTGELVEFSTDGADYARLLWKARSGWNVGDETERGSGSEKARVVVIVRDIYICESTRIGNWFEKVGQLDGWVLDWGVDANGVLWTCLDSGKLAKLELVAGSFNAVGYREYEAAV